MRREGFAAQTASGRLHETRVGRFEYVKKFKYVYRLNSRSHGDDKLTPFPVNRRVGFVHFVQSREERPMPRM